MSFTIVLTPFPSAKTDPGRSIIRNKNSTRKLRISAPLKGIISQITGIIISSYPLGISHGFPWNEEVKNSSAFAQGSIPTGVTTVIRWGKS
jgi:hypothetical protein